jgi:ferritin-like metal-binding protein YciE
MQIQHPQDLFLLQLGEMYDIEQKLTRVLPELAQETQYPQAREAFLEHEQETLQHIRNLESCFQLLGCQPLTIESHAAEGLKQDHDTFVQQLHPSPNILAMFDLNAGREGEYLQIAHYQCLIEAADTLGYQRCVPFLQENLQQEVAAAQKLAVVAHQLGQQGEPVQS